MSKIETNQVDPSTGTTLTLGTSGDTIAIPSGVTIANSGTATGFGANTPAFAATDATNAISSATYVKAQNGTEVLDTDSCYDNSSNYRFTPNVAGKYYLKSRITVDSDSNMQYIFAAIYKNGSRIAESRQGFNNTDPIGNNYYSIDVDIISEANGSSDYFETYVYMHQDGDFEGGTALNLFLGYRIIGA